MNTRIYLSPPHIGEYEQQFVAEAFASNWIAPLGPQVDAFEHELAEPVFIDSEPESWNMSPCALERAFLEVERSGKFPKAVIIVKRSWGTLARIIRQHKTP
jgi:pyridoxal phosphate-dependent aminotransferase EpsN